MASKVDSYYSGRDVKSICLNIASTMLLSLPVVTYLLESSQQRWMFAGLVFSILTITILVPPVGYKRPHPYSDFENNRIPKKTS